MASIIKTVYLDLDGIVRNWTSGIISMYNLPITYDMIKEWDTLTKLYTYIYGGNEKEFWDGQGKEFWEGLQFTQEATEIIDLMKKVKAEVVLLTAPTLNNAGWSQRWIRENMPDYFHSKRYILGPDKKYLSYPDTLLIDDGEKNVVPWIERGGQGFLFPRPWNRGRNCETQSVSLLKVTLEYLDLL